MAKVIFLFPTIKIVTDTLEDLQATEDFLEGKYVDELGYDPEQLALAYEMTSKNYKFGC